MQSPLLIFNITLVIFEYFVIVFAQKVKYGK